MTASSVGFRPMRRLDFKHNAADVELMRNIMEEYKPHVYFAYDEPIYTDGRSVYGHVTQRDSNGFFIATPECEPVTAFTRVPIPE